MKKLENCQVENCIPSPTSCSEWNGGDIPSLGICNGEPLNDVVWEIINKIEDIAGDDLSKFDIDALLDICSQKAPLELNLLSILNVLKENNICLKDYIDTLNDKINELSSSQGVKVDLKCYADFDNLGNALSITRDQLDQLVINNLCNHKLKIEFLEGKVVTLQSQIDNIDLTATVEEPIFGTCINPTLLPTSSQVLSISAELCDLETALGAPTDISVALALTPGDLNAEFGLITGWTLVPAHFMQHYGNTILELENIRQRLKTIEATCCAVTCDDIELGFTAVFNEDNTGIIIKFTSGAGTSIPAGFTDAGSTGVLTDKNGVTETFTIDIADNFNNNNETEILISGLDLTDSLDIDITAKLGNGSIICEKCIEKTVKTTGICDYCEICVSGTDGSVIVIYEDSSGIGHHDSFDLTTTSTTTTTTAAP